MANLLPRMAKTRATPVRRAGWAAWVASLTILVVAWAPLLGSLHQALVRHVVCEHGDLVEPDERGAHPALSTTASHLEDVATGPAVAAGAGSSLHGHSHCSVGVLAQSVATVATSSPAGALLAQGRAVSLAARDARPVLSILSSAPKTSPPISASGV